jgi:hypothetical protein
MPEEKKPYTTPTVTELTAEQAKELESRRFRITRAELVKAGCCQLDRFEASIRWDTDLDAWALPGPWNASELDRLARDAPEGLLWLIYKRLVPASLQQGKAALERLAKTPEGEATADGVASRAASSQGDRRRLFLKAFDLLERMRTGKRQEGGRSLRRPLRPRPKNLAPAVMRLGPPPAADTEPAEPPDLEVLRALGLAEPEAESGTIPPPARPKRPQPAKR